MKKLAPLLLLVVASLSLAACGGGGSSSSTTTSGQGSAAGGGGGAAAGGGGSVVAIEAAPGSELAYATEQVSAKAGPVTVEFTNPQEVEHDVVVEDANGNVVGKTDLVAAGKATADLGKLAPGTYSFYCSVPGHREAGMEGKLTVK